MTPVEEAWLAGLLEGEGCFAMGSGVQVILQMTDEDVVRRAAPLMGADRVTVVVRRDPRHRDLYSAKAYGEKAETLMRRIRPYLGERRGAKVDELLAARDALSLPVEDTCKGCSAIFLRPRAGRGRGARRRYCEECKPRV